MTGFAERKLLCFRVDPGKINGMNAENKEKRRNIGVRGSPTFLSGIPAVVYRLAPTEKPPPGEPFVAMLDNNGIAMLNDAGAALLKLNPWFPTRIKLVCGTAPDSPALWENLRGTGAKIYTFIPDGTSRQP